MKFRRFAAAALVAAASATTVVSGGAPATANPQCEQEIYVYFWTGYDVRNVAGSESPVKTVVVPPVNMPVHSVGCIILEPDVSSEPTDIVVPGATFISSRFTRSGLQQGQNIQYVFKNHDGSSYFNEVKQGPADVECNLDQAACDAGQGTVDASSPLVPMSPTATGLLRAEYYFNGQGAAGVTLHSIDRT